MGGEAKLNPNPYSLSRAMHAHRGSFPSFSVSHANVYYICTHTKSLHIQTQIKTVMARILTQLLLRHCTPLHSPSLTVKSPPFTIPLSFHYRHSSFKPQLIEINLASSSSSSSSSSDGGGGREEEEEEEALLIRKLEEIIHRVMLQKSTPDWLPFIPGSSFWVPPERKPLSVSELAEKLTNRLSDEESLALTTSRGWPSSSFFIPSQGQAEITVVNLEERVEVKVKGEGEGEVGVKVLGGSGSEEDVGVTVQVLDSDSDEVRVQVLAGSDSKEGEVAMQVLADSDSKEVAVQGSSGSEEGKVGLEVLVGSDDGEG